MLKTSLVFIFCVQASTSAKRIKLSAYSIPLNYGSEINEGLKKKKLNVSQRMEMMKEIAESLIRNNVFHPTDDYITTVTSQVFKKWPFLMDYGCGGDYFHEGIKHHLRMAKPLLLGGRELCNL